MECLMLIDSHPLLGGAGNRHPMLITSAHLPVMECLMLEDSHPLLGRAGHRHLMLPLLVLTFL